MAESSLSGINITLKTSDDKEITLPKEVRQDFRAGGVVLQRNAFFSVSDLFVSIDCLQVYHTCQLAFRYGRIAALESGRRA